MQIVFRCLFKSRSDQQTHHAFSLFKDHLKRKKSTFIYIQIFKMDRSPKNKFSSFTYHHVISTPYDLLNCVGKKTKHMKHCTIYFCVPCRKI